MDRGEQLNRLLLKQEIEEFLYHEADLLDERRYEDWLALVAEDVRYWMPMRRNVKVGEAEREFTRGRAGHQLVRRRQGDPDAARQADPDRHALGRGASLAHFAHGLECAAARGQPLDRRAGRGLGQMPVPDLPQPRRDR